MHIILSKAAVIVTSSVLIFAMAFISFADSLVTVPIGTIIPLRMETPLNSGDSHAGDSFTASVIQDVQIKGRDGVSVTIDDDPHLIIPAGSRVEGHVTAVNRAERMSRAGTIAITFDRLVFPNGNSIPIEGTLTSLNGESNGDLEDFYDDERIEGNSQKRRAIVFIGAGAGVGAIIGAMTKGGKGAAVGAGVGAALGTISILLSRGGEASVEPGTEFGLRVERTFTLSAEEVGISRTRVRQDDPH